MFKSKLMVRLAHFFQSIFSFLILIISLNSCIPNSKLIFLNDSSLNGDLSDGVTIPHDFPEYRLQTNDIIHIDFKTSIAFINESLKIEAPGGGNMMMGAQNGGDIYYMTGYKVDHLGFIKLPLLQEVKVQNLTIVEVEELLELKIKEIVNDEVFVRVKLGGIRFSTMGEVNRPGKYTILQDRVTLFEAIAHSGDLNSFANRKEILLIRQYPEGSKIFRLNLLDRAIIKTPFYFIQNNDQIYAQPLKQRELARTENASQNVLVFSSILTTVLLLINLLK